MWKATLLRLATPRTRIDLPASSRKSIAVPQCSKAKAPSNRRRQRAGKLESDRQCAAASHAGAQVKGVGQPIRDLGLDLDRLARPHDALEAHVVHARHH